MALRYEWTTDPSNYPDGMAVSVNDGTNSGTATLPDAIYAHTSLTAVLGSGIGRPLGPRLEVETDAVLTTNGSTITYNAGSHTYTLAFGASCTVDFRSATLGDDSGVNLAKWLGFTSANAGASGGTGYDCVLSGASSYTSDVRPYGLIVPTIQGRSDVSDEYEPEGASQDNEADDGTSYGVSKDTVSTWLDWTQTSETGEPPAAFADDGMPVFEREETAAVPWSYQRAFRHARDGWYPFLVVDGSESLVCELRAEGTSFRPTRFASKDYPLWSVSFRTRLRGRL